MRLSNTSGFPDLYVRRMLAWVCHELELPVRALTHVAVKHTSRMTYSGLAYWEQGRIILRIGMAEDYPVRHRVNGIWVHLKDRTEGLVFVTAHEVFHIKQIWDNLRQDSVEKHANQAGMQAVRAFREKREELEAAWSYVSERPLRRAVTEQDSRRREARKKLDRWEARIAELEGRLKNARIRARRYRRRASYYERRIPSRF